MRRDALFYVIPMVLAGAFLPAPSRAQGVDFSGTYSCEPQPLPCRLGATYVIAQTGNDLVITIEGDVEAHGHLAGNTVLTVGAPLNMLGVVQDGGIQWSNGTKWFRQ